MQSGALVAKEALRSDQRRASERLVHPAARKYWSIFSFVSQALDSTRFENL